MKSQTQLARIQAEFKNIQHKQFKLKLLSYVKILLKVQKVLLKQKLECLQLLCSDIFPTKASYRLRFQQSYKISAVTLGNMDLINLGTTSSLMYANCTMAAPTKSYGGFYWTFLFVTHTRQSTNMYHDPQMLIPLYKLHLCCLKSYPQKYSVICKCT